MPNHVEALLTAIGVPAEEAASIVSLPEDQQASFDATPYAEKVKANYQTQFKNDPSFFSDLTLENMNPEVKKKLENTQYGRSAKIVTDKFLKLIGMSDADFADLPQEERDKMETLIPKVVERWQKNKSGDKQLQQELIDARKKLEAFGPEYEENIKKQYETQAEAKYSTAIFNANLISELSSLPGLKIPAGDLAPSARERLLSKYGFERVGDLNIELRQKANPQMKVLKNGSSQELTLKEALMEIATESGWVEAKQTDNKGTGKTTVVPTNDGLKAVVPPHLQDKIGQKIAAEKQ